MHSAAQDDEPTPAEAPDEGSDTSREPGEDRSGAAEAGWPQGTPRPSGGAAWA